MGETDRGVALPWTLSALVVTELDFTFKYPADDAKPKTHKQRTRRSPRYARSIQNTRCISSTRVRCGRAT